MKDARKLLWFLPIALFLAYLPYASTLDLSVAKYFSQSDGRFHAPAWCLFIYTYGLIPGQLLFIGSVLLFIASFFATRLCRFRWTALYISLTLIIGSGIFGHAIFKQFWTRPRPKQTILFGGKYPYCPLTSPYVGPSDRFLRSLPSGHATMGFYFLSLFFVGKRLGRRSISRGGLCITAGLGTLVAWARLAQGGHFLSDIIVSMILMWMTAYWLDYCMYAFVTGRYGYSYSKAT